MVAKKNRALGLSLVLHLGFLCALGMICFRPAAENHPIMVSLGTWPLPVSGPKGVPPSTPSKPAVPVARAPLPSPPLPAKTRPIPIKTIRPIQTKQARPTHQPYPKAQPPDPGPGITTGVKASSPSTLAGNVQAGTIGNPAPSCNQSYFASILARINAAKRYPPSAARRQMEGNVMVSFQLDHLGQLLVDQLVKSSGFRSLDEAALEAVRRAAPYPRVPERIETSPQSFTVTLAFVLKPQE